MKKFVNTLTLMRIIATLFLPLLWHYINPFNLLIIVVLILLTDFFDGFLARKFHVQSLFGSLADAIADKAFGIMILLIVANTYKIFYLLVAFEIIIALINVTAAIRGATTKSSFLGKFKMWLLGISIVIGIAYIFQDNFSHLPYEIVKLFLENQDTILISSVFITCGSELMVATDYSRHIIKELKTLKPKIKYKFKKREEILKVLFDTEYYLKNKSLSISKHLLK